MHYPDITGQRQLIQQGRVGGLGHGRLEGIELGLGLLAFVVELGEPVGDPGPHGGRGGVGRIGGQLLQAEDLGFLRGVNLGELGLERGGLGVTVGFGGLGGGGQLGGDQLGAVRPEYVVAKEQAGVATTR